MGDDKESNDTVEVIKMKNKKRSMSRTTTKVLLGVVIVGMILILIIIGMVMGYIPSARKPTFVSEKSCTKDQMLYLGKCYNVNNTPLLVSSDPYIDAIAGNGCLLPFGMLDESSEISKKLSPACNSHHVCYYAIDALDYTIGKPTEKHQEICDERLFKLWSGLCDGIHPNDILRTKCRRTVEEWSRYVKNQLSKKQNIFKDTYFQKAGLALKNLGTPAAVSEKYRVYMETPFIRSSLDTI